MILVKGHEAVKVTRVDGTEEDHVLSVDVVENDDGAMRVMLDGIVKLGVPSYDFYRDIPNLDIGDIITFASGMVMEVRSTKPEC